MSDPEIVLHGLAPSHPCMAADKALRLKGLDFERVDFQPGPHVEEMKAIYGEGNTTVPGMTVDGEPVHGSSAIFARLEEIAPNPALYPSEEVRDAERWGNEELQHLGRRLPWGALWFRPEAVGTFAGGEPLDPAGVDFAMKLIRATWKYHGLSAELLAAELDRLPGLLDRVDELVGDGVIGGDQPNAADLQIGSTMRVINTVGDVAAVMKDRPCERLALDLFPDYAGHVPAGAYPAGWLSAA